MEIPSVYHLIKTWVSHIIILKILLQRAEVRNKQKSGKFPGQQSQIYLRSSPYFFLKPLNKRIS